MGRVRDRTGDWRAISSAGGFDRCEDFREPRRITNERLRQTLEAFCREASALIAHAVTEQDVRLKPGVEIDGNQIRQRQVPTIDWLRTFLRVEATIQGTQSYETAVRELRADPKIASHLDQLVGTSESRRRIDVESLLRSMVLRVVDRETGEFSQERFNAATGSLEACFYRDTLTFRFLATLHGFSMPRDQLVLDDCAIVRIPKEQRERILSEAAMFGLDPFSGPSFGIPEFGLEFHMDVPKLIGSEEAGPAATSIVQERFDEICSTLRLYKAGFVGFEQIRAEGTPWVMGGGTITKGGTRRYPMAEGYSLSDEEVNGFEEFFAQYKRAANRTQPGVAMAVRRLNFVYERQRVEDKLVDYCIAFETLLLQEKAELEHRLALRVARLLGRSPDEHEQIYLQVRAAYGTRSDIVHGEQLKPDVKVGTVRVPFNEFVKTVEDLLRSSIRRVLLDYSTMTEKQMLKAIDRLIARGE